MTPTTLLSLLAGSLTAALAAGGCASTSPRGDASWRYDVRVDPALNHARVRVCFPGAVPEALVVQDPDATDHLSGLTDEASLPLDGLGPGDCVGYRADLQRLLLAGPEGRVSRRGDALMVDPALLLLTPPEPDAGARVAARFHVPGGFGVSSPWPPVGADPLLRRRAPTPWGWPERLVVGRVEQRRVRAAGATLEITVLPGRRAASLEGIERWLAASAEAVARVHGGRLPFDHVQVLVEPTSGQGDQPVVFGRSRRGGGSGVLLLLDAEARDDELPGEWIAIHEIFHHTMPNVSSSDAWLSEGATMYYSETLQGRAGFLTPAETWSELREGFERGRRDTRGLPLHRASALMGERAIYHRVYWSGAAIALRWDLALRRETGGAATLDDAMTHLARCCLRPARTWSADEVLAELDRWWGSPLFSDIAEPLLEQERFPDLSETWEALGIEGRGEWMRLAPEAPDRRHRRAIVSPGAR